jgi:hypothetical protein
VNQIMRLEAKEIFRSKAKIRTENGVIAGLLLREV